MKKALLIFLALTLIFASSACSSKKEEPSKSKITEETTAEEQADLEPEEPSEKPTEAPTEAPTDPSEELSEEPDEVKAPDDMTFVIGKSVQFAKFEIVITELKVVKTWDDQDALRITYDWTNKDNKEAMPSFTFAFTGFQNKVETEKAIVSYDVDLKPGQKKINPGGKVTGAHTVIGINDINAPLLLELSEAYSLTDEAYSLEIEDLNKYK